MMKTIVTVFLTTALLLSLTACTAGTVEQKPEATPQAAVEPTPEPTLEPTPEPTPEPPQYMEVMAFAASPQQYIYNEISKMPGLDVLLGNADFIENGANGIRWFNFENYTSDYDAQTGDYITNFQRPSFRFDAYSTYDWDYQSLTEVVSRALGIEYKKEIITMEYENGRKDKIDGRFSVGDDTYASSWIHYNNLYAQENLIQLSFIYGQSNEKLNLLAEESLLAAADMMDEVSEMTQALADNETTLAVSYQPNTAVIDEETLISLDAAGWAKLPAVGCVTKRWNNVSEQDAQTITRLLEQAGYEQRFYTFNRTLDSAGPFSHSSAFVMQWDGDEYIVEITLYYN